MKSVGDRDAGHHVLQVPRERAADVLQRLHQLNLVDRATKTTRDGPVVLIPLIAKPPFDLGRFGARFESNRRLPARAPRVNPHTKIREALAGQGISLRQAPRRWEMIGDVVVLRIPNEGRRVAKAIARIYGEALGAKTVVEDVSGIHGPLRVPEIRRLWGDGTRTIHVEDGVRYAIDVGHLMFSSGNLVERMRIARLVRPGAIVVDLFAGIGYFTLPVALRSRAALVYACELNPIAFEYLTENIRLNRATNVVPLFGDCRETAPRGVADSVIMGHFAAREYLDVAFRALRGRGSITYHELCPKEQFPDALTRRLAASARSHWLAVNRIETRIVKSYAPGIVHATAEVEVSPQSRGHPTKLV